MVIYRNNAQSKVTPKLDRKINEKIFIGTLGVNCVEFTRRCIDTVVTKRNQVRFVYIDNGSKEENIVTITNWKKGNDCIDDFLVGINGYNAGVAVGWNQLIKMALEWQADKIIICNNDIAFGPNTIDGMSDAFDKLRKEIPETVMITATNHSRNPAALKEIKQVWKYQEHPDFSCFMITPDFIEKVGYFCEDYEPAFFEDNDMHWRILMMGYKAFSTDWAPYSHVASRTRFGNPDIVPHAKFRKNKLKFFQNMLTDSVDQEIANQRYARYVMNHPDSKHPNWQDVIKYAVETGMISDVFIKKINKLTISEVT